MLLCTKLCDTHHDSRQHAIQSREQPRESNPLTLQPDLHPPTAPTGFTQLGAMDTPAFGTGPSTIAALQRFPSHGHRLCPSHLPGARAWSEGQPWRTQRELQVGLTREDEGAQRRSEPSRDPATCSVIIRLVCFYLKYYPLTSRITKVAQQYRQAVNINRSV